MQPRRIDYVRLQLVPDRYLLTCEVGLDTRQLQRAERCGAKLGFEIAHELRQVVHLYNIM